MGAIPILPVPNSPTNRGCTVPANRTGIRGCLQFYPATVLVFAYVQGFSWDIPTLNVLFVFQETMFMSRTTVYDDSSSDFSVNLSRLSQY